MLKGFENHQKTGSLSPQQLSQLSLIKQAEAQRLQQTTPEPMTDDDAPSTATSNTVEQHDRQRKANRVQRVSDSHTKAAVAKILEGLDGLEDPVRRMDLIRHAKNVEELRNIKTERRVNAILYPAPKNVKKKLKL